MSKSTKPVGRQLITLGPKRGKEPTIHLERIDPKYRPAMLDLLRYSAAGSGRNRRSLCLGVLPGGKLCPCSVAREGQELCESCLARKQK